MALQQLTPERAMDAFQLIPNASPLSLSDLKRCVPLEERQRTEFLAENP